MAHEPPPWDDTNLPAYDSSEDAVAVLEYEDIDAPATPTHPQYGEPTAIYPYRRLSGDTSFVICRFQNGDKKEFRPAQLKNGKWVWNIQGQPTLLYRFPEISEAIRSGETVWIVDGEKDADALAAKGVAATTWAHTQGWAIEHAEELTGAKRIRIVQDRDGGQGVKQTDILRESLVRSGAIAASDIEVVEAAEGKDAFDHIDAGLSLDAFTWASEQPSDAPAESQHTWVPVDLVALALDPPPPPTISGIVYPGQRHIFSGEPESLKSWALFCIEAAEIQKGECAMHIDLEMGRAAVYERLRHLGLTDEQIQNQFIYVEPSEAITAEGVLPYFTQLLEERKPSFVAIDAFTGALAMHGYSPNDGIDVQMFYNTVVEVLRKHGAAVVLLDHLPKDKENRGKYSIGSERKVGEAEVHLSFSIIQPFGRGKTGKARLTVQKDRPGHLPRPKAAILELISDEKTGHVDYTWNAIEEEAQRPAEFRPTTLMEKISRFMEKHPEGASRNKIETDVQGAAKGKRTALDILVREGYLAEEDGPNRTRITRFAKPYKAPPEGQKEQFVGSSPGSSATNERTPASESPQKTPPLRGGSQETNLPATAETNGKKPGSSVVATDTPLDAYHESLWDKTGDEEFDFDNVDF